MVTDFEHQQNPSAEIILLNHINAYFADWLSYSKRDHAERSVHDFTLAYGLKKLVAMPTPSPRCGGLAFFIVESSDYFSCGRLSPIGKYSTRLLRL